MPSGIEVVQPSSIVNETLRLYPATTAVFNEFGIDACCGGAASISGAASRDGADPTKLLKALNGVISTALKSADQAA